MNAALVNPFPFADVDRLVWPGVLDQGKSWGLTVTGRTDVSTGRFLSLEPPRRIVWTVEFESADEAFTGEMIMSWSFDPTTSGTRVTVTVENVPAGISQADHDQGLRSSLENLAKHVS